MHIQRHIIIWSNSENMVVEQVDVICEYKSDGKLIPYKFRIMNEDGEYETYSVKEYRELPKKGAYTTQDGIYVSNKDRILECKIVILGTQKITRLYYNPDLEKWRLGI